MFKVLSFRLANDLYGIEINHVKEMNRNVEYTPVPRAPDMIVGLFNMRGQIVSLFNLAQILGLEPKVGTGKATCIILKTTPDNPDHQGFLIDTAGDVLDLDEEMCEDPPANVEAHNLRYVKNVARLDQELLMIIDPAIVFAV